jgi:hypothetical protein
MGSTVLGAIVGRLGRRWTIAAVAAIVAIIVAVGVTTVVLTSGDGSGSGFPQNAAMESSLGVRISRVAVVGDGGLISVSYVVLDGEKASRFQTEVELRPTLTSESGHHQKITRVAIMKQGHQLRAGQTYYLVYENRQGALHSGGHVSISVKDLRLRHVPVI